MKTPTDITLYQRKKRLENKAKVFAILGGMCVCCLESNPKFLTIDHIRNDGYLDRRRDSGTFYAKMLSQGVPKDKYQLLCWNCNCGRALNGGICPHKTS